MDMHLFYTSDFSALHPVLSDDEAHHALKVLRLQSRDTFYVTDGKGSLYTTTILSADYKKPRFQVIHTQTDYGKRPYHIHIAVAPTKNSDRTEWLVEKCVELGVDVISFIQCDRSERKHFKTDRLEKIVVSAMKQSLKAYLPEIRVLESLEKFLQIHMMNPTTTFEQKKGNTSEGLFIAHLEEGKKQYLSGAAQPGGRYCILIGPEGDFSPKEIDLALLRGFLPVSLGESRLRTETAAMYACCTLNTLNLPML